jgi:hypothetical protein
MYGPFGSTRISESTFAPVAASRPSTDLLLFFLRF